MKEDALTRMLKRYQRDPDNNDKRITHEDLVQAKPYYDSINIYDMKEYEPRAFEAFTKEMKQPIDLKTFIHYSVSSHHNFGLGVIRKR